MQDPQVSIAFRTPLHDYMQIAEMAEKDFRGNLSKAVRRLVSVGLEAMKQSESVKTDD